jgi:hypothetical protein
MGREALEMQSAHAEFLEAAPVPEIPTVTRTPGCVFWNSSATASVIGNTVLDPSIRMIEAVVAFLPHPRPPTTTPSAVNHVMAFLIFEPPFSMYTQVPLGFC